MPRSRRLTYEEGQAMPRPYAGTYTDAEKTGYGNTLGCVGAIPGHFDVMVAAIVCQRLGNRRRRLFTPVESLFGVSHQRADMRSIRAPRRP